MNRTGQGNAQMWYNVTRDFQTFSEAAGMAEPRSAVAHRHDRDQGRTTHYYQVAKDEAGNAGSDIFSEKHTDFLDSDITAWTSDRHPHLGGRPGRANAGLPRDPLIFKANPGDTACPGQFYLWGDRYTNGGGYQASVPRGRIRGADLEREGDHDDERRRRRAPATER